MFGNDCGVDFKPTQELKKTPEAGLELRGRIGKPRHWFSTHQHTAKRGGKEMDIAGFRNVE